LFEFATSQEGTDEEASHRMYLVRPQESWDEDGVPRLVRAEPTYIFLSSHVAARTVELMAESADTFRERLASAFDHPPTRGAAGKLVESILHRALLRGLIDPFGVGDHGLSELALGEAPNFILEAHMPLPPPPLYLRPQSQTFAAVDAIVVTDTVLWLVQSSVSDRHSLVFKTLLATLLRLEKQGIEVTGFRLVFCLIGTDDQRVRSVARSAARKLTALKAADSADQTRELGQSETVVNRLITKMDVEGYSFVTLIELTRVWPAPEEDTAVA
jgi:hypothetical protein